MSDAALRWICNYEYVGVGVSKEEPLVVVCPYEAMNDIIIKKYGTESYMKVV